MKLSNDNDNNLNNDLEKGVLLETKPKTKKPSMYNVLLLNDDYTPMEFVVLVLESVFNKKQEEATQICFTFIKMVWGCVVHLPMKSQKLNVNQSWTLQKNMNIPFNVQWKKIKCYHRI